MKIPTFLGVAGLIAIYVFISGVSDQGAKTEDEMKIEKQRKRLLAEVEADQAQLATTYGWVDKSKGVVRIPIDRAMEITVNELK